MQIHPDLAKAVRHNCDISDARYAGSYSICGLALRLRDLYKWEHDLEPWIEKDPGEILQWIDDRENHWESLADSPFARLHLNGTDHDPFDTAEINAALNRQHLHYGALYAQRLKPMFFLARIDQVLTAEDLPVIILGREFARDLMTVPALNLDGQIIVRTAAARLHLWDQMVYIKKSGRPALEFALTQLGLTNHQPTALRSSMPGLLAAQMDTYIYHEIGEVSEKGFDRDQWRRIIADHPQTPVELLARASKDLLADTHANGPLRRMIRTRNKVGLALYTAFCDGLLRELFRELRPAFAAFAKKSNWDLIADAVDSGNRSGRLWAEMLMHYHTEGFKRGDADWARAKIERRLNKHFESNQAPNGAGP